MFHRPCVLVIPLRDRRTPRFHRNSPAVSIVSCVSRYAKMGVFDRTGGGCAGSVWRETDVVTVVTWSVGARPGVTKRAGGGRKRASLAHSIGVLAGECVYLLACCRVGVCVSVCERLFSGGGCLLSLRIVHVRWPDSAVLWTPGRPVVVPP